MAFELPQFQSTLKGSPAAPNFSFNPGANVDTNIAQVALQKQQQQMQQPQQSTDNILRTVKMASDLAQSFVEASKMRQQKDAIAAYAAMQPNKALAPVLRANPQTASDAIIKQAYPGLPTSLGGLAVRGILSGNQNLVDKAATTQQEMQKLPQSQKQNVLLDDKPGVVNYVPGRAGQPGIYQDDKGQQIDASRIKPIPSSGSTIAEVRKSALLDKMNATLAKTMQPSNWTGTSPAAISAKLVVNAESAKALADQMLSGQVPANSQTMGVLNTDVARVIGQQGVVTNEGRHELETATGYSKLADALQFFQNHPEDRRAGAFITVLKKEMQRQQDLRQKVVDQTMASNLAAHQEFRKLDPEAWAAGLEANGVDSEAAKKGHFKLKKSYVDSLQLDQKTADGGWQDAGGGIKWRLKQ